MILGYTRPRGEAGDIEPGPCFGLQKTRKKTNNCSAQDLQCTLGIDLHIAHKMRKWSLHEDKAYSTPGK
jgi:hypothetical protein